MKHAGPNTNFKPGISLSRAMVDPRIFGETFAAPSFWTWRSRQVDRRIAVD